jgi:hypothetical protein
LLRPPIEEVPLAAPALRLQIEEEKNPKYDGTEIMCVKKKSSKNQEQRDVPPQNHFDTFSPQIGPQQKLHEDNENNIKKSPDGNESSVDVFLDGNDNILADQEESKVHPTSKSR